ncbi:BMP family protein [Phormidium tenue FACHB-886]|nr:BMP family protein [Phormidium tenue FACHB-886]
MITHFSRRRFLVYSSAALGASLLPACAPPTSPLTGNSISGKLKVAGIYTLPVSQQWISCIHRALVVAQNRGEIEYRYAEAISSLDYDALLRQYADEGQQLIVGECFAIEKACRMVAADYPDVAFLMGSGGKPAGHNLSVFDNYIHEPSYLTGMIAGGMTRSKRIGMVGGYPIPEVNRLMNAFMAGAKAVTPDVKFLVSFINNWFDPTSTKAAAFAQVDAGADILYAERISVAEVAEERKVLAIGSVINIQPDYPDTVVASALWHVEPTIDRAIVAVRQGTFTAEDYGQFSYVKYEGASLAPFGTFENKIPAALKQKVRAKEAEIKTGKFTVEVNNEEPRSTVS